PGGQKASPASLARPDLKRPVLLTLALVLGLVAAVRAAETAPTPADQLGWQMTLHARTFMRFPIMEAMDKTAALGLKYMSLSGNVNLTGTNPVSVLKLSDQQVESLKEHAHAKGLK